MPLTRSRYDGYADWHDGWNQPHAERNAADVLHLLGPGEGLCLDLGCGCGHYFDALASTGRTVIGLDRSADQLRVARGRYRHADRHTPHRPRHPRTASRGCQLTPIRLARTARAALCELVAHPHGWRIALREVGGLDVFPAAMRRRFATG